MDRKEILNKIEEIANNKGWYVDISETKEKSTMTFVFQTHSRYGRDFDFELEINNKYPKMVIYEMEGFYDGFDVDYETYIWIGANGHGINGAPYHIEDILNDTKWLKNKIEELICSLKHEIQEV